MKYIPVEKLITEIERRKESREDVRNADDGYYPESNFAIRDKEDDEILSIITSLQQEQPANMIQWTGQNLREVVSFTGMSPKFNEYFKSWDEFEQYVHSHSDIFKLFCEDGSHYEVPKGAWIVKTPDGHNIPSVAKYIRQEQSEVDLEKEILDWIGDEGSCENGKWTWYECNEMLRHFAEWGAIHLNARKK